MDEQGRQESARQAASLDREHSVMRRQVVVIEIEYDATLVDSPRTWDWHTLADLGLHEHAIVLAAGPEIDVSP